MWLATTCAFAQQVGVEVEEQVEVQQIIEHAGLTREEVALSKVQQELYVIQDIISEQTVFITLDKANEYFVKSLDYYNRPLGITTKKAILKAKKDKKKCYVNIVGGSDIPEHRFGARNNVYEVSEYTNGQYTIFIVEPSGRIFQDHYECGDYGQLGRDGVSFEHSVKTFGAISIRDATKRAVESNKKYDWEVTVSLPDMSRIIEIFDTFMEYELWMNQTKYSPKYYTVKKIKKNLKVSKK